MLFAGGVYLALNPSLLPLLTYLLMIYTSGEIIWPKTGSLWGFDLTPVVLGETRRKIKEIFTNLKAGRVALELTTSRGHVGWSIIGTLGYILAEEDIEILNTSYVEIGDYQIFEKYCQYFNAQATQKEFEIACIESGVKYMVAFTEEFRSQLDLRGFRKLATLSDLQLSESPYSLPIQLAVYELPWQPHLIVPETDITVSPGQIRFNGSAGQTYRLRYSAFVGWRCFQQGKRLDIKDTYPGMAITAKHDGEVVFKYSYRYYWF
jgi:hypothetical protein